MLKKQASESIKSHLIKNKKNYITTGVIILSILFLIVIIVACINFNKYPEDSNGQIDYTQEVTNPDGTNFSSTYNTETSKDLSIRFPNLKCNEDCSNLSNLKIGEKTLQINKDYEVKPGSITIIIYNKILQTIKSGQYDITFDIENNNQTLSIGLKITISNNPKTTNDEYGKDNESTNSEDGSSTNDSHATNSNSTVQNSSSPTNNPDATEPEPKPTPEPEPEPTPTHTAEFNLNDGYQVSYLGVHIYKADENQNPIYNADGTYLDSFSYNKCEIQKNSATIKTTYNTSDSHNITYEQWQSEIQTAEARGLIGQGGGWIKNLDEQYCDLCSLSCDRW